MQVKKEFEFESAHRLSNYIGKCSRVHGHNYKVIVTCENDYIDNRGILIDFGDIKKVVKEHIIERFDHRLILNGFDEDNRRLFREFDQDWLVWVEYNPTAENMANHFLAIIKDYIPFVKQIEVFETPDSSAIASI